MIASWLRPAPGWSGVAATALPGLDKCVHLDTAPADERPRQGRRDPRATPPTDRATATDRQTEAHPARPRAARRTPAPPPPDTPSATPADRLPRHAPALAPRPAAPTPRQGLPPQTSSGTRPTHSTRCASTSSSTTRTGPTTASPAPRPYAHCPNPSPNPTGSPTPTSADATTSAASCTNTNMQRDQHGRGSWHLQRHRMGAPPGRRPGRATQQVRNLLMTLDDTRTASIRYLIRKMPAASSRPSSAAAQ